MLWLPEIFAYSPSTSTPSRGPSHLALPGGLPGLGSTSVKNSTPARPGGSAPTQASTLGDLIRDRGAPTAPRTHADGASPHRSGRCRCGRTARSGPRAQRGGCSSRPSLTSAPAASRRRIGGYNAVASTPSSSAAWATVTPARRATSCVSASSYLPARPPRTGVAASFVDGERSGSGDRDPPPRRTTSTTPPTKRSGRARRRSTRRRMPHARPALPGGRRRCGTRHPARTS